MSIVKAQEDVKSTEQVIKPSLKGESASLKGSGTSLEQSSFLNGGNDGSGLEGGCWTTTFMAHSSTFRRPDGRAVEESQNIT